MIDLLKRALDFILAILPGVRAARRAKAKRDFRAAAAKGDAQEMNRLWREMEDKR